MSELLDRITAARKHAEGRMERATFQADYRDWQEVVRLLEDVRDELNKPTRPTPQEIALSHAGQAAAGKILHVRGRPA